MSQESFQSLLARMVVDAEFRRRVRDSGMIDTDFDLTDLERRRLLAAAQEDGLSITSTLHTGFRLGKILSMLPLTSQLLGSKRLSRELKKFWGAYVSHSFYYLEEAIAFCDFLERRERPRPIRYLDEVVAYERARLEAQRPEPARTSHPRVRFEHDPQKLLEALVLRRRPRSIPKRACWLTPNRELDGSIRWDIEDDSVATESAA